MGGGRTEVLAREGVSPYSALLRSFFTIWGRGVLASPGGDSEELASSQFIGIGLFRKLFSNNLTCNALFLFESIAVK